MIFVLTGGGEICSGKGECVCGECQCVEEDGGRYSGKYCEECPVNLNDSDAAFEISF